MSTTDPAPMSLMARAWQAHPDPQLLVDATGVILAANDSAGRAWQRAAEAMQGQRLDALPGLQTLVSAAPPAAGFSVALVQAVGQVVHPPGGETLQLGACEALAPSQHLLIWRALDGEGQWTRTNQQVLDGLHDGVLLVDAQGRFLAVNRAAEQALGVERGQLQGRRVQDMAWLRYRVDGSELPPEERPIALALASTEPVPSMTLGLDAGDGSRRWLQVSVTRIDRVGPGLGAGVVASFADITAQIDAMQALRESERQFRVFADHSQDVIWIGMPHTPRMIFVSRAYERLWGRPVSEVLSRPGSWLDALHPEDRARVASQLHVAGEQGYYYTEFRVQRPDGSEIWVRNRSYAARDEQGQITHLVGIAEDITDSRLASEQLRQRLEAEEALSRLVATAPGVLLTYRRDAAGRVSVQIPNRRINEAYRMLLPDGSTGDIREVVNPEDRQRLKLAFDQSAVAMRPLREEFRVTHPKLGPLWVEIHVTPVRETDGVMAWHGFLHDITSRKQVESEIRRVNLELEARVAERTAELEARNKEMEAFSYSVSHDLKAPLRGIDGYSRLLLTDHADALNEEGRFFVDTIRKATVHMGRLIDDLLAYSRVERSRPTLATIDPAEVVHKVLASLKRELEDGQVELQLTLDCHQAVGEREGLTMAVRNLLDNALKFTHGRTPRRIEVCCIPQGSRCLITVKDNGPGFDMRYHDRIFEIFQRLHRAEDYPGTGVGLAIVRKAMERMRGRVWAHSELGEGATFSLELPLPEGGQSSARAASSPG